MLPGSLFGNRPDEGRPSPPLGNVENSAAHVVDLTSFPFSSVLRWWVEKTEELIFLIRNILLRLGYTRNFQ
jgi:hypothetical protein